MAVDPNISLGVQTPSIASSLAPMLQMQGMMQQQQLFRNQMAARQKLGQILSAAPDINTGMAQAQQDPDIAAYGGEAMNLMRQQMQTNMQIGKDQQTSNLELIKQVYDGVAASASDPVNLATRLRATLSAASPAAREAVAPVVQNLYDSQFAGLPSKVSDWTQQNWVDYQRRSMAYAASAGHTPEQMAMLTGKIGMQPAGDRIVPYIQYGPGAPAALQGTYAGGAPIGMGLAPTTSTTDQVVIGGSGSRLPALGGRLPPGATGLPTPSGALAPPAAAPTLQAPVARGAAPSVGAASPGAAPAPAAGLNPKLGPSAPTVYTGPAGTSGIRPYVTVDGKPLWDASTPMVAPASSAVAVGGARALTSQQKEDNSKALDKWNAEGAKAADGAQATLGSLEYLDSGLDHLHAAGGAIEPGPGGEIRLGMAKAWNTIGTALGIPPENLSFNPRDIASGDDVMKETGRLGAQVTNFMFGQQKEAAQTIIGMTKTVPGLENSWLGGKLVTDSLRALANRAIDERNFVTEYKSRNGGTILNAEDIFNAQHPAVGYTDAVLNKYGLGAGGWRSIADIANNRQNGWLNQKQAQEARDDFDKAHPEQ